MLPYWDLGSVTKQKDRSSPGGNQREFGDGEKGTDCQINRDTRKMKNIGFSDLVPLTSWKILS